MVEEKKKNGEINGVMFFDGSDKKTRQADSQDCDINKIMKRFETTGELPTFNQGTGMYGDFASMPDFVEAKNIVSEQESLFEELPIEIRDRFHYNVEEWLSFLYNPENKEELVKMGIKKAEEVKPTEPAKPVEPAPGTGKEGENK